MYGVQAMVTYQLVAAVAGGQARDGDVGAVLGRRRLLQPVVLALLHGHAAPLVVLRLRPTMHNVLVSTTAHSAARVHTSYDTHRKLS